MSRTKDDFIRQTGGFRTFESDEEFKTRIAEIKKLESDLKAGNIPLGEREKAQRRLCDLKGIDFDSPDDED